jgi:hypothetical protein
LRSPARGDYPGFVSARVVKSSSGAPDDAAAQLALRAALERLEAAPFVFLGVPADATPSQARAAFLGLTKQYHPAKYARFSPDTVRLANEVFLALKRVCDGLMRPRAGQSPRLASAPTASAPVAAPSVSSAIPRTSAAIPRTSAAIPRTASSPVPTSPAAIPRTSAAIPRTSSSPVPRTAPATRPPPVGMRPPGTSGPIPVQRSAAAIGHARTTTPMRGVPQTGRTPRIVGSPGGAATTPAGATAAVAQAVPAATTRIPRLDVGDNERGHFEQGLELLRRRMWSDGERLFTQLSVAVPTDKRYRAYRDYARGRIAQDLGRHDEARTEWQRALALDPTLAAARAALEQLPEPEPTKPTGLLGKLFRR